jgi:predicted RNA-binding Zn-ribbon protein involved in translation (DUF1610 family)
VARWSRKSLAFECALVRRRDLQRRARAGVGIRFTSDAICLACGWQGTIEYARPAERWTCYECGRRELIRDDDDMPAFVPVEQEEGEA